MPNVPSTGTYRQMCEGGVPERYISRIHRRPSMNMSTSFIASRTSRGSCESALNGAPAGVAPAAPADPAAPTMFVTPPPPSTPVPFSPSRVLLLLLLLLLFPLPLPSALPPVPPLFPICSPPPPFPPRPPLPLLLFLRPFPPMPPLPPLPLGPCCSAIERTAYRSSKSTLTAASRVVLASPSPVHPPRCSCPSPP